MTDQIGINIAATPFDPDAVMAEFRAANGGAGAIVSFLGQVRAADQENSVNHLILEHYPGFTEDTVEDIASKAAAQWPVRAIQIVHRVGSMTPGEPIVLVAAAADHRRAAFEAADYLMDYLKSEAPFWKREETGAGSKWIEPRDEDYRDKARWTAREKA